MPALSVMIKPASSACNMRCGYCFYHDVANLRSRAELGIMDTSTARAVIDSALDYCGGESISFAFQGGEPLLAGADFFKEFFAYAKKRCKGVKIYYGIQTNGTLLTEETAELFAANGALVGLSLDGGEEDNSCRVHADLSPSFGDVMKAAEILRRAGTEFNVLSVVTGRLADNIERVYSFFKSHGFRYLQFIPCLRPFEGGEGELYMTNEQYAHFLTTLFRLYARDFLNGDYVSIRRFDNWVRLYRGEKFEECGVGGFCSRQFVVEGNGNVYPCDFYCLDEWLLGNINSSSFAQMAECRLAKKFITSSLVMPARCARCEYFNLCRGGGCKRARTSFDYCEAYKKFFTGSQELFRRISEKMGR